MNRVFSDATSILNGDIIISSLASNLNMKACPFNPSVNSFVSNILGKTLLPLQKSFIKRDSTWKIAYVNPLPRSQLAFCPTTSDTNRHWWNSLINESWTEGILRRNLNLRYPFGILSKSSLDARTYVELRLSVNYCSSSSIFDFSCITFNLRSCSIFYLNSSIAFCSFSFLSREINSPHPIFSLDISVTFLVISSSFLICSSLCYTSLLANFLKMRIFSLG